MKRLPGLLVFALIVAGGTAATGWWIVPLLAALRVRTFPRERAPVATSVAGAALGWALLLAWAALRGPAGAVARRAGGALGLPPWGFVLLTLGFAALLAGTAAQAVRPARSR
jgi:hypothetical protein